MIRGRKESGVDLISPSDLRAIYLGSVKEGKPLPVSFALGSHPCDFIGAISTRSPGNEVALLGAMRGAPVPLVKCITNDIYVPADVEA
jgi:UbiD family decarboxylase